MSCGLVLWRTETTGMSPNRPFDTLPASVSSLSWSSFASYMALPKLSELPGNVGHRGILAAGCFVTNDTESTIVHDLYGFWLSLRSMWNIHNEIQNLLEIQVAPQTITMEPEVLTALYWQDIYISTAPIKFPALCIIIENNKKSEFFKYKSCPRWLSEIQMNDCEKSNPTGSNMVWRHRLGAEVWNTSDSAKINHCY